MKKYISFSQLMEKLGQRSRSSIYRDMACGRLPQPYKIGHRLFWCESEVDAAMQAHRI